ncbi:Pyruvate kinase [uncultured Roseburia sp.]|uniref:Pyruvate kinase n=1 Tax=Brotonthovivens ammoniilytica TaxID=2981725 RepID=A0ABT2TLY6_9FIRM|nr:pyruvate kinase [Brotonthovivens ammoniilytica]MCU6763230.1 pyruvate kinase [Brotonthovivens ammoniilytica]SCJ07685.1 Pyruvate kinase [uncultured Roseburia sp.]
MKDIRKTKIICTLGPSTDKGEVLKELILEGMNVARFNFSHGTHQEQKKRLDKLIQLREELNLPVAALLDTKGPEIRLRNLEGGKAELKAGQKLVLTTEEILGSAEKVAISYKDLYKDVHVGSRILIDDGLIEMEVTEIKGSDIACVVKNGGMISDKKGVNVPNAELSMPYISETDYSDIVFGIESGFDFIAASFVRTADDVLAIRKILEEHNCSSINIIAKIENKQGVDNIDDIIKVSDGIMVARGDMGVEIPFEEVPVIQKMIIEKVYMAGKQVITATQMLDSMMKNPRPTRAEAADVANAVYDGTSAIMLSGETAAGLYPVEALQTMVKIAIRTEKDINYLSRMKKRSMLTNPDITNAIAHATCTTAMDLNAAAIITVSNSGRTARMVSKYRPGCPILGCSVHKNVCRQLNLSWGVTPLLVDKKETSDELFDHAVDTAERKGLVKQGELVVLTAGVPLGVSGTTNLIKVHVAGHILASGKGISEKTVSANLCVAESAEMLGEIFKPGDIIVAKDTSNEMMQQIRKASGLIVEAEGTNSHAAIVGLSLDMPVILGAKNAVQILKTGAYVTLDGRRGTVSCNSKADV